MIYKINNVIILVYFCGFAVLWLVHGLMPNLAIFKMLDEHGEIFKTVLFLIGGAFISLQGIVLLCAMCQGKDVALGRYGSVYKGGSWGGYVWGLVVLTTGTGLTLWALHKLL